MNDDRMNHDSDGNEAPPERMARIGLSVLEGLDAHPENEDQRVQAVICLIDPLNSEAGAVMHRIARPVDAVNLLLLHADSIAQTYDITISRDGPVT